MENQEDDLRLLETYRARGDAEAIDRLVGRYGTGLFSFLCAMTRDRHDAEEIFQETWLKVMRNADRFQGGSFKAWLTTIARRTLIDKARRKFPLLVLDAETRQGHPRVDGLRDQAALEPCRGLESEEELKRIRDAVRRLPDDQREVFLLRTQQELSFKEIASALSIPLNTALGRMHYAVSKLRKELHHDD